MSEVSTDMIFQEVSESDTLTSYPLSSIVWTGKTAYSEVVIADSPTYGRMLFLDDEVQSAAADEAIYHESLVHPIMASLQGSKRVLVVGGGEGATVREVLKWSSVSVVWVDIDGQLVDLCREHLGWAPNVYNDPRVQFMAADIKDVLGSIGLFDVVILDLPDPDGDGYLYSVQFWKDIQSVLKVDGRIVSHAGPVRPFGNIGAGLQQIWKNTSLAGIESWVSGFYQITIPSFQGSWGFWINGVSPLKLLTNRENIILPPLNVVDKEQILQWVYPPLLWRTSLEAQRPMGYIYGACTVYDRFLKK